MPGMRLPKAPRPLTEVLEVEPQRTLQEGG
jgi:hypothetical protein